MDDTIFYKHIRNHRTVRRPFFTSVNRKLSRAPTTMTEAAGLPSASIPLGHPDPDNPQLSFGIEVWLDPPNEVNEIGSHEFISTSRPFLLDNFRKTSTPLQWNRYILLGYFSHIDGVTFDEEWNQEPCNLLHRHKIVWYNFMSHVDRNIDIPMSLEAWATQVSQPYLMEHQPSFLQINTIDSSWKSVDKLAQTATRHLSGRQWVEINQIVRSGRKSPSTSLRIVFVLQHLNLQRQPQHIHYLL